MSVGLTRRVLRGLYRAATGNRPQPVFQPLTLLGPEDLPAFVAESDRLVVGSPSCHIYWSTVGYRPRVKVDTSLDPFSDAYFDQQLALYREMSGRDLDQENNELTEFDLDSYVNAGSPYGHVGTQLVAPHYLRMAHALTRAVLPDGAHVLDMGAGWGLSSEFIASMCNKVTAVDINPQFVELVRRRQLRHGLDIAAQRGGFDDFVSNDVFDAIFFYECLHHAIKPWEVVARLAPLLASSGKMIMAAEPFNTFWWPHWGLRFTPDAIYAIHKFGWFESGWSAPFMGECCDRAGLSLRVLTSSETELDGLGIAYAPEYPRFAAEELNATVANGWLHEGDFIISNGQSVLAIPGEGSVLHLELGNYRASPLTLEIFHGERRVFKGALAAGASKIAIALDDASKGQPLRFNGEVWRPIDEALGTDTRHVLSSPIARDCLRAVRKFSGEQPS